MLATHAGTRSALSNQARHRGLRLLVVILAAPAVSFCFLPRMNRPPEPMQDPPPEQVAEDLAGSEASPEAPEGRDVSPGDTATIDSVETAIEDSIQGVEGGSRPPRRAKPWPPRAATRSPPLPDVSRAPWPHVGTRSTPPGRGDPVSEESAAPAADSVDAIARPDSVVLRASSTRSRPRRGVKPESDPTRERTGATPGVRPHLRVVRRGAPPRVGQRGRGATRDDPPPGDPMRRNSTRTRQPTSGSSSAPMGGSTRSWSRHRPAIPPSTRQRGEPRPGLIFAPALRDGRAIPLWIVREISLLMR